MDCVSAKCTVRNANEKSIFCWLCNDCAHLKCAGFNGKSFDKLIDPSNGFRWLCWKCREAETNFNILFQETRKSFADLKQCLNLANEKLLKFENRFMDLKFNNARLNSSPKRKKPSTPSNLLDILNSDDDPAFFLSPAQIPSGEISNVVLDIPNSDDDPARFLSPAQLPTGEINNVEDVNNVINDITERRVGLNMDGGVAGSGSNAPLNGSAEEQNSNPINLIGNLVVVPPRRTIFISRLANDTSVENLVEYLKKMCSDFNDTDCKVFKFNYSQPRDISSFKIIVPDKVFHTIIMESFWPTGMLVKEFIPRDRQGRFGRINLPVSASKN